METNEACADVCLYSASQENNITNCMHHARITIYLYLIADDAFMFGAISCEMTIPYNDTCVIKVVLTSRGSRLNVLEHDVKLLNNEYELKGDYKSYKWIFKWSLIIESLNAFHCFIPEVLSKQKIPQRIVFQMHELFVVLFVTKL